MLKVIKNIELLTATTSISVCSTITMITTVTAATNTKMPTNTVHTLITIMMQELLREKKVSQYPT